MKTLKRLLTLILITTLAVGAWAERVSQEDASAVANNFMNASASASGVRKATGAKRMVLKKAPATSEEQQYYIYEDADGEGWVMVAANDIARPILAYSDEGQFRTDHQPANVKYWLGKYNKQIKEAEEKGVSATEEVAQEWRQLRKGTGIRKGTPVVAALIQTKWDQDEPYWNQCPTIGSERCLTGCVATAMAQVMNYWQWPVTGTGSASVTVNGQNYSVDFSTGNYDWNNMLDKYRLYYNDGDNYYTSTTSGTTTQKNAVAKLMYHCGVAAEMDYGTDVSGAYTIYPNKYSTSTRCAQYALIHNFGYNSSTIQGYYRPGGYGYSSVNDATWHNYLKTELDAKRPIMYAGADNEGGHSFICDGYDNTTPTRKYHFNWGWSGYCDGYYDIDALVPGTGGSGAGNGSYNEAQDIIIGIMPPQVGHNINLNGTGCSLSADKIRVENGNSVTVTITPTDATYDYTSTTVQLGSATISSSNYTLSANKQTLTINGSAITGDASNALTITVVWTKNRYKYEMLGEHCTMPDDGMLNKNAALNLTITPDAGYTLADAACWDVSMGGSALTYGTGFTYNPGTGAFYIASVTGDVEILAYGGHTVTWSVQGINSTSTFADGAALVLPDNPSDCSGVGGKKFVGWTANSSVSGSAPADLFNSAGSKTVTANTTYYAVYAAASGSGSGTPSSATYTFSNKSWNASPSNWTSGQDGAGYSNSGVQVTTGASGANATCPTSYSNISSIVVSYCTNSSKGAGTIKMTVDGNDVSQSVSTSGGTTARDLTFDFSGTKPSGAPKITITCTTNSIYVCGLTINYGGGGSYSDYSLTCGAPVVCALTGITLNTSGATTSFTTGDAFSSEGLVVTASYSNCSDAEVTPTSISSPDMSTAGSKTITVSYTENGTTKTATYTITVSDPVTHTVTWSVNGTPTSVVYTDGQALALPATPSDCSGEGGKKFVGWTASSSVSGSAPADLFTEASGTVTADATYYAVYATASGSSTPSSATYTFSNKSWNASPSNWTSGQDGAGYINSGVQVTATASGANATCPIPYSNISSIVVSYCTNGSSGAGSITMAIGSITLAESVTKMGGTTARDLTFDFSSSTPSGAPKITVTCTTNSIYVCGLTINYGGGGGTSYSDYSLTCGAPVVCALSGITLNTSGATTTFTTGDTFSSAGLVVTAHYSNCADATVTPTSISSPDMSTAGIKTITVSYTENGTTETETYTITVSDPATHTVTWSVQGNTSTTTFADGAPLVVPSPQPVDCSGTGGKIFVGWTAHSTVDGSEPDDLFLVPGTKTVTADITYYAVYADYDVTSGGGAFDGDTEGYYKIYSEVGGTKYYATGTVSSGKMSGTTNEADAPEYTFTKVSGGWTIQNGTTYITYSGSSNLGTSTSSYTWTLSEGSHGTWRVASGTNSSRAWIYRAGSVNKFGGYSTSNVNGTEYFDLEIRGGSSSVITYSDYSLTCTDTPTGPTYTVTYMACGAEFTTQTYPEGAALVLPSSTPGANAGKSFAGWTATEHYTGASAPTLITAGGAVNADATYYAVFH